MNNKALSMSLIMAALAVLFVSEYVSTIEEEARKKFGAEILVVKAKKDIKEMETINETHFETKKIPKRFLEPAAISFEKQDENDKEIQKSLKDLAGNIAIVPIKKGEQITFNKITEPSMRTGLAPQITPGKRAVAVAVNEITGLSKLVKPGDRVDVIATFQVTEDKRSLISKTVLQDVVVLSAGRNITNNIARLVEMDAMGGKEKFRNLNEFADFGSVTLEVEPAQAQLLSFLKATDAALILSLRNNDDNERQNYQATGMLDILGQDAGKVPLGRGPAGGGGR